MEKMLHYLEHLLDFKKYLVNFPKKKKKFFLLFYLPYFRSKILGVVYH